MYALWRNGELLGTLAVSFPGDSHRVIAGVFKPANGFADIVPAVQVVLRMLPERPVIRGPLHAEQHSPQALRRPTPAERKGLAPEDVWELRDANGVVVDTEMIILQSLDVPRGAGELPDACRAAGVAGEAWMLCASLPEPA